jgi:hypothetical protein
MHMMVFLARTFAPGPRSASRCWSAFPEGFWDKEKDKAEAKSYDHGNNLHCALAESLAS